MSKSNKQIMSNNNIRVYRTAMGDLLARLIKDDGDNFVLKDVLSFQVSKENDILNVGFGSIAPFAEGSTNTSPAIDIVMPKFSVLFSYVPSEDLRKGYIDVVEENRVIIPEEGKIEV